MTCSAEKPRPQTSLNPTPLLAQRLQAADTVWHDFMAAHHACRFQDEPAVNQNLVFLLFAKFVLELIPDNSLRTQLFEYFEPQFIPGTTFISGGDECSRK
jgi:hypothetical protein